MTIQDALDPERLSTLAAVPAPAGTGGPLVPLPDGGNVSRDLLAQALAPIFERGRAACDELVDALADPDTHIRYGAHLALRRLGTPDGDTVRPLLAPDSPANEAGREVWRRYCVGTE